MKKFLLIVILFIMILGSNHSVAAQGIIINGVEPKQGHASGVLACFLILAGAALVILIQMKIL